MKTLQEWMAEHVRPWRYDAESLAAEWGAFVAHEAWARFKQEALRIADDVYYDRLNCTLEEAFSLMDMPKLAAQPTPKGEGRDESLVAAIQETRDWISSIRKLASESEDPELSDYMQAISNFILRIERAAARRTPSAAPTREEEPTPKLTGEQVRSAVYRCSGYNPRAIRPDTWDRIAGIIIRECVEGGAK